MSRIEITGTGLPGGTAIRLDGRDIANGLRGLTLTLTLGADRVAELRLDVAVFEGLGLDVEDVRVYVPEATRELLARLGWTPPAEP